MKSLLLTILLLGLVAVLKAQEAPPDDLEDVRMEGTMGGGRRWPDPGWCWPTGSSGVLED
jgi:hypothetical protein